MFCFLIILYFQPFFTAHTCQQNFKKKIIFTTKNRISLKILKDKYLSLKTKIYFGQEECFSLLQPQNDLVKEAHFSADYNIPTKHFCILVTAPLWSLIYINFL